MPLELTRVPEPAAATSRVVEATPSATVTPDPLLAQAAEDSILLVDHCVRHERRVGREVLAQVMEGARAIRAGAISPDVELRFWEAFGCISKAACPASAESLRLAKTGNKPFRYIKLYTALSVLTLLLVIAIQVYWLTGSSLLSDLNAHIKAYDETERAILDLNRYTQERSLVEAETLYMKLRSVNAQLQTDVHSLHGWNQTWAEVLGWLHVTPPFRTAEYQQLSIYGRALVDSDSATLVVRAIFTYVLPLLYGLLGACVYIIRGLSRDIRLAVFTHESASHYLSRFILGPIAGVVIGMLVTPDHAAPPGTEILHAIGLPALAFIAGYSVEIVFALMDRIIASVSKPSSPPQSHRHEADWSH